MRHVKFIVLTSARTGSTWLIDLLNAQPGVEAHGELFLRHRRLRPPIAGRTDFHRFIEAYDDSSVRRVPRVISYLNELYRTASTVGFKLMYSQLRSYPEIVAYLAIRHVRVIHLIRRNLIDVIVSEELARLTGTSHAQAGSITNVPKVHLDATTLIDRISTLNRNAAVMAWLLRLSLCPVVNVTYEAMLAADHEFKRILNFLDIPEPASFPMSSLTKRGSGSHRDSIANYEEIRKVISSTRFASMLR